MKTTRGIRNCNPGNLRLSKDRWKGLRPVQTDKEFFQFEEMKWGYRALMRTLQNYRKVHGCRTVADFIRRWRRIMRTIRRPTSVRYAVSWVYRARMYPMWETVTRCVRLPQPSPGMKMG